MKKIYHETTRLCLSRPDICMKEISDHVSNMDKEKLSKFGSLQIRNFIYSFCVDDAELMTASLNLLRERRSSVTTEYCSVEARY